MSFKAKNADGGDIYFDCDQLGTLADPIRSKIDLSQADRDALKKISDSIAGVAPSTQATWTTVRNWAADAETVYYNSRPTSDKFVPVIGLAANTLQLEVLVKIKTTASSDYGLFIWVSDGTEVYCVSPAGGTPGENSVSILDPYGAYDAITPVLVDLKRYTPTLKVAAVLVVNKASIVFDAQGNCGNSGFTGGEAVYLSSIGTLPLGLSASITAIDPVTDTITFSGATFADGEPVRINLTNAGANIIPLVGLSASGEGSSLTMPNDFVLDGRSEVSFAVGDQIRYRGAPGSSIPQIANGNISPNVTYTVISVSGQSIQISTDGVTAINITSGPCYSFYYFFKFPYIDCYFKGTNQLSYTKGGPAIDFKFLYTDTPVTVTPGTASIITQTAHGYSAGKKLIMVGNSALGYGGLGYAYYVKNPKADTYELSQFPTGLSLAFTSAGTAVQMLDPVTNIAKSITATIGTPATITLPNHRFYNLQPFTIGGSVLPDGYTGQKIYVIRATETANFTSTTFQFSECLAGTPCVFGSAGTSPTLTASISGVGRLVLEKTGCFIASNPAPTDATIAFANTLGGAVIPLAGGTGNHAVTGSATPKIKAGSYVKVRAL
jgi:hypothetical protein